MNQLRTLAILAGALSFCLPVSAENDAPARDAENSEEPLNVFEGMQKRQVEVKLTQRNEKTGTLFVRNPTDQAIKVAFPEAFVGVHVANANLIGNGQVGRAATQIAQSTGVSFSPSNTKLASDAAEPDSLDDKPTDKGQSADKGKPASKAKLSQANVFEVPAGKTVQFPVTSVCLEYGKPEPKPNMAYLIVPVEKYSRNPVLHELLPLFAKHRVGQRVAQAAAWHVSNGLSWTELSGIMGQSTIPAPMFDRASLQQANRLVNEAATIAVKKRNSRGQDDPRSKKSTDRTDSPRTRP